MPGSTVIDYPGPKVHTSPATIKITVSVPPMTGQAVVDIALFMLPTVITTITLPLVIHCCHPASATSGPSLSHQFITRAAASLTIRSSTRKKVTTKLCKCGRALLAILCPRGLVKASFLEPHHLLELGCWSDLAAGEPGKHGKSQLGMLLVKTRFPHH